MKKEHIVHRVEDWDEKSWEQKKKEKQKKKDTNENLDAEKKKDERMTSMKRLKQERVYIEIEGNEQKQKKWLSPSPSLSPFPSLSWTCLLMI